MANAKKCDICGKLYEQYNVKRDSKKPNGFHLLSIDSAGKYFVYDTTDCCLDCMESILQHIQRLKGENDG